MPIRYLILSLTTRCNLQCRYCYIGRPVSGADMPADIIGRAMALAADGGQPFHLQLTGGEPTLVPEMIAQAAVLAKATGRCSSLGIQTNATGLTPEVLKLFKTHGLQVGVSLDGPPSVHEAQRGMAAETLRGLQLLESTDIPFRVTTVVTQSNVAALDRLVLTLAGFRNARGIGLDLLVNKGRARRQDAPAPAHPQALQAGIGQMIHTLNRVNARRTTNPIQLRERDLLTPKNPRQAFFCHAARMESVAVAPDGGLYPCGQTLGDATFSAGTIWEPRLEKLAALGDSRLSNRHCHSCEVKGDCPGDCPSRLHYNSETNRPLVCDLYQTLWQTMRGHHANLLRICR